jgi:hypothetical protein
MDSMIVNDQNFLTIEKSDQLHGQQSLNFCLKKAYCSPSHHRAALNKNRPLYANKLPNPKRKIIKTVSSAKAYIVLNVINVIFTNAFPKERLRFLSIRWPEDFREKVTCGHTIYLTITVMQLPNNVT